MERWVNTPTPGSAPRRSRGSRCGKNNRGIDLPDELRRRKDRLDRIRQARKEMEAETAAAAARQRQEQADQAKAEADTAEEAEASAAQQAELNR